MPTPDVNINTTDLGRIKFKARFINPDTSGRLQALALTMGFHWYGMPLPASKQHRQIDKGVAILFDAKDKDMTILPDNSALFDKECVTNPPDTLPDEIVSMFIDWLNKHILPDEKTKPKQPTPTPVPPDPETKLPENMTTPQQPITPPPPTTVPAANPYEMMVNDIVGRVISHLPKQQVDEQRVQEIVNGIITKQGRLLITIEDKRKTPAELHDIREPVHNKMPDVFGILKAGCWCCCVGPTGSGKTLGALQYAKMAKIDNIAIKQMTRIIAPHDLIGFMDANGKYRSGAWTDAILGYRHDNKEGSIPTKVESTPWLLIVDEMDNSNENIVMIIKALQTGKIMMPYGLQDVNPSLLVMATMNTWGTGATREYVGRMAQDAALLNEFSFVEWDYDVEFEWSLLANLFQTYKDPGQYTERHMQKLHSMIIAMRSKAEEQKVRVMISTRNLINIAKKLLDNPKWGIHKVLCMDIYRGLKNEDIKRIECPDIWGKDASNTRRDDSGPSVVGASTKKGGEVNIPF